MAGSNRQRRLKIDGVETFIFFFVSLCISLSMLFVPILSVGAELETCDEEVEFYEEFLAPPDHKRVRNQREQRFRCPWKSWNAVSCCSARMEQDNPLTGHRLKHDLLAPLTC